MSNTEHHPSSLGSQRLADEHRYRTRIDDDGTKIIPAKVGHIYEYDGESFGVMVMPDPPRKQYWGFTKAKPVAGGFKVVQDGDREGAATFDPADLTQVKLAIRAAGVKRRRILSPQQREQCVASLLAAQEGHPVAQDGRTRETDPVTPSGNSVVSMKGSPGKCGTGEPEVAQ